MSDFNQLKLDAAKLSTIALIQNARGRVHDKVMMGEQLGLAAIMHELANRLEEARQAKLTR